jgi:hypothetical protein
MENVFCDRSQDFADAPNLRHAANRVVRGGSASYLGDVAQPRSSQMLFKAT